jgi:ankyrin repeat protein
MGVTMRKRTGLRAVLSVCGVLALGAAAPAEAPVADAAMRGDVAAVRALIDRGADVNAAQGDGMTALHWAGETGTAEMARMLLAAGANLEARTRIGDLTPLLIAAEAGNGPVVGVLVESGADVEARSTVGGGTALHYASESGDVASVRALLQHGADPNVRQLEWEQTPLIYAASKNRVEVIRTLLEAGADPSLHSRVWNLSLQAIQDRRAKAVRDRVRDTFREAAPDPVTWRPEPAEVQSAVIAARPHEVIGEEPTRIDWEAWQLEGKEPSYADLVEHMGGLTPLLHAVREGHRESALALVQGGADVNQVSAGDHTSPLLMAMVNGHFDLGLELLERGADPNLRSDAGAGPLYAVINQRWIPKARFAQQLAFLQQSATHIDAMRALLEAGADPNARLTKHLWYMEYNFSQLGVDTWGATPFWRAAHGLDVEAMRLLISHGADPNIPTKAPPNPPTYANLGINDVSGLPPVPVGGPGVYPIHVVTGFGGTGAARAGNSHQHVPDGWMPAVRYLVEELGADVNQRDFIGYTPVHHAAGRGMNDIILYLVEKGADVLAVARTGQTTVDMANGPAQGVTPFPETMTLLEGMGAINNNACIFCE